MLAQCLQPGVGLLTHVALVYPRAFVLNAVLLQFVVTEELHPANGAAVVPLLQMV